MKFKPRGLYVITTPDKQLIEKVEVILKVGITLLQYRDKESEIKTQTKIAYSLHELCQYYQTPLIINDNIQLAKKLKCGVHLGKDDGHLIEARNILGQSAIIGKSCYSSVETAVLAEKQSADYVAFGRFYRSKSKPDAAPADLQRLQQQWLKVSIPIVAIGGITVQNAGALLLAGVSILAVIDGVFGTLDVGQSIKNFNRLMR